jgi:hypothetical protein
MEFGLTISTFSCDIAREVSREEHLRPRDRNARRFPQLDGVVTQTVSKWRRGLAASPPGLSA